ncbi:MAG: HipA N-terminal domain-containing protein [Chitinivibrionales bacterium]|nr:HipA N-terminal domain-containing protein [Chitinivibrionales bacterium]
MNKKGLVYYNGILAGELEYRNSEYLFRYDSAYLSENSLPPISFSFPKKKEFYRAKNLFPFFYGLLAEGADKELQCATLKIDENDHFARLLKTAGETTIGAVTVREAS